MGDMVATEYPPSNNHRAAGATYGNGRGMEETICCSRGALLDTWSQHDWGEGVQIDALSALESLAVRTRNSLYEISVVQPGTAEVLVRGGHFFPQFTRARLVGSSLGGSFLKLRGVYLGFSMELQVDDRTIVTSPVRSVAVAAGLPC